MGEQGMGTTMKVVVNSLLTLEMQAIAEATALGEKAGIGREHLMNVLSQTTVIAPAHAAKLQNHKKGEYPTNFALYLAYKDLGLVRRLATQVSTSMPATAAAEEMYAAAVAHGYDSADFSVMMKFMDQMSNITPQD
jgi:3-hydroxyisobutyrate dehydrogenase-like beta-hydroxyacid dehydrogenase